MKTTTTILRKTAAMLFASMLVMTYSCDSNGDDEFEPRRITVFTDIPEDIVHFFEDGMPFTSSIECFLSSEEDDAYLLINDRKQFHAIYSCDGKLPDIDFTKYSLVIGKKKMPNSYYTLVDQSMDETKTLNLNIVVELPSGHWTAFSDFYYWGLYPKLPNKELIVKVVVKREQEL